MSCLFVFKEEGKSENVEKGESRDDIIAKFSTLYDVRKGGILQKRSQTSWLNVDKEFTHSDEPEYRYLIPSNHGNLDAETCAVFCCDMQERFRPAIKYFNEIIEPGARILTASSILDIPVIVTEQYPKGLGSTISELNISHASLVAPKTRFSMLEPQVLEFLHARPSLTSVILFGVEAHVCVQQSAIDLCRRGYEVHVVVDATSSRSNVDRHFAYERLQRLGIILTTSENVILQLLKDKNHPNFKQIQTLIKTLAPDCGLLPKSSI